MGTCKKTLDFVTEMGDPSSGVANNLKTRPADKVQAGLSSGDTTSFVLRSPGEHSTRPKVGVVGLPGRTVHHHELALRSH